MHFLKVLKIVLFLSFQLITLLSQAQSDCSLKIRGEILESKSHVSIPFASINVVGTPKFTQADEKGAFELEVACSQKLILQISQFDYKSDSVQLIVQTSDQKVNFYLRPKNQQLSAITVHAHQEESKLQSNLIQTISAKELMNQSGRTVSENLSALPGVFNIKTGPGINKPMIHGLYGSRVQIINNDVAQMGQQWGTDHAPEIDPFLANRMQVVKGAASVKYGPRAIGGAILIQPEDLIYTDKLEGKANLTGFSNGRGGAASIQLADGYLMQDTTKSLNWRAQASVRKIGDRQAPNYFLTNTGAQELNYSLASNFIANSYQVDLFYSNFQSDIGILRGAHVGNVDDLKEAINRRPPFYTEDFSYQINSPKQFVKHQLLKSKLHFDWTSVGEMNLIYAYQQNNRQEYDVRRDSDDSRPNMDLQLNSHIIKVDLDHLALLGSVEGNAGFDMELQNNFTASRTGSPPLIPNYESVQMGIYIAEHIENDSWLYEFGLRYDLQNLNVLRFDSTNTLTNPTKNYHMFAAIVGSSYDVNKNLQLKANMGVSQRAPNISELYSQGLHHSIAAIEIGNSELRKETAQKVTISGIYRSPEKLVFESNIHFTNYQNYIYLAPEGVQTTIRGAFLKYNYQQADALIGGLDLKIDYELFHHFLLMSQYSMIRGYNSQNDEPLIFMPADRLGGSLYWKVDKPSSLLDEFDMKLTVNKLFKQNRAPRSERYPLEDMTLFPIPEGYTTVDGAISFTKKLKNTQLNWSLSVNNIFNTSYVDYLNRLRFYADEAGRNIELRINYLF